MRWNGPLCKIVWDLAVYFNNGLRNSRQKLYYCVLLNKSHVFKFFLKAEVLLNRRFNELEGFCLTANEGASPSGGKPMPELFPVCSASPAAPFPPVQLLGSALTKVKDVSEHCEHEALTRTAALRVLHRCCYASFLKHLIFLWNRWVLDFCILASNLLLNSFFSWARKALRNNSFRIKKL